MHKAAFKDFTISFWPAASSMDVFHLSAGRLRIYWLVCLYYRSINGRLLSLSCRYIHTSRVSSDLFYYGRVMCLFVFDIYHRLICSAQGFSELSCVLLLVSSFRSTCCPVFIDVHCTSNSHCFTEFQSCWF